MDALIPLLGELVPLISIVMGIGMPLSIPIIFMVLHYRKRRRLMELHHTERMAAIERGMELPPFPLEVIAGNTPRRRRSSLLPGLVWLFIGIAMLICMHPLAEQVALLGLIPAGVGLAYLIYYLAEGRRIESQLLITEMAEHSPAPPHIRPSL
jgi:hypothetical protein